ncbi:MAG: hypothetical protein IJ496_05735 [Ruminococcus sp.]|nr:hypothetical protein [Ruminococcus sp.]
MAKFWCKVCDEPLGAAEGAVVATCTVCGARQALPHSIDDEYLAHVGELKRFRQNGEFEKALALADGLLKRSEKDAALYWQRALIQYQAVYRRSESTYGYELVCQKEEHTPVSENEDFQKALQYASAAQRGIYEEDAKLLERARRTLCGESYVPEDSVSPLNSGFLCLEDGEWEAAVQRFDHVLTENSQEALAYFGKMMAELQVHRESELSHPELHPEETENFRLAMEYGNETLREKLSRIRETGILTRAAEEYEKASTVDDWKRVKKLLSQIPENEKARERIILCEKKIREIMMREAQVLVGCREAANLGLTTDTLGTRMVNASYYYDFDMPGEPDKTKKRGNSGSTHKKKDKVLLPVVAAAALLGLAGIVIYLLITGGKHTESDNPDSSQTKAAAENSMETSVIGTGDINSPTEAATESSKSEYVPSLCAVGERVFILRENGSVQCLFDLPMENAVTSAASGASFSGNVAPYASDWSDWEDVRALYSDPSGDMLFAVMENGTVAYDIFSSSEMKYEQQYKVVSAWLNVQEIQWDSADPDEACLFALTKDGRIYASDLETEETINDTLELLLDGGLAIESMTAQNGRLHILFDTGSYFAVDY